MKSTGKTAVGYVRVSTERQASEGVSLEAQEARIRAWATAQGLELAAVHVDAGLSGGKAANRPGLQAALADACKRRAPLVVYSLSRMARSTRDALTISERLDKAGADLVSLSESIDTTSAAGKMVFRMLAVLAEFERDLVSERTTSALAFKRRQGERISGKIPYGYRLEAGRLVAVEEEQTAIRLMMKLRTDGLSLRAIAEEMERREIRRQNGSHVWPSNVVLMILRRAEKLAAAA
jgi:DNA invertase Pin-like site-specific DNA recombinase